MLSQPPFLVPDWPLPSHVHAATTTRGNAFNLATHVEDDPAHVATNRAELQRMLALPQAPHWLQQVHGTTVVNLDNSPTQDLLIADASFSHTPGIVCAVLTADCLPILVYDSGNEAVAAIHGGWRGLHGGIVAKTLDAMQASPSTVSAWLGPAISGAHYQVGNELYDSFCTQDAAYSSAFQADGDKWLLDISKIATIQLNALGVTQLHHSRLCTFEQAEFFFSYRRDGKKSGRMATLIWISQE